MSKISVAFIDGHPIMMDGLISAFSRVQDFQVVARGTSAADAVNSAVVHKPDVLVLDLNIDGNAYEAMSKINGKCPNTKVVVFTGLVGVEYALRALELGASGFVSKGSTAEELCKALVAVVGGETYITQRFATQVISALRDASLRKRAAAAIKLSIREEQIVRLLLRGKTNKEIANQLAISEKTVKHYMTILMQKLNARNRIEVVLAAQNLSAEHKYGPTVYRN
ncbi:response regulator transcription factor [Filomicrobium sp.]|uniref:LuxR C-terminal-related transcriptional regulator n=1 Tax=Filomicrobium sp. TaxID=2024831 RepID=UPI0025829058|nr:response regulator transcription factor [Filomicrobium sp.]MCV0370384.1 response regulator transcription factor [Filomicrobium sp.]